MNVDKLTQQVETACGCADALRQRTLLMPMVTEILEELHTTLEELRLTSSELRQHHQVIEAERERYMELFQEAPDGYLVTDENGSIQNANRAAAILLNTQQEFLLGQPLSRFIADEQRPAFRAQLNQLHQGEQVREWTVLLHPIDATPLGAALRVNVVHNHQGTQLRVVVRDVTEDKRALEKERLIAASAHRIRQSLNVQEILNTTVAEVRQLLQTDRVIVYRFQPDWTGDVVAESVASGWQSILGMRITDPLGETYIQSHRQGQVTAIENIYTAGIDQYHIDLVARFGAVGNLVVPILYEEQLWGLLIAHHCSGPRQWQQLEIDLLKSLATQAAIAIYQAQHYEQTQHQAQREQALNRVTQAIHQSLDLETVFSTTVNEIRQLLGVSRVVICHFASVEQGKIVAESVDPTCPSMLNTIIREPLNIERIEPYRQGKTRVVDDVQQITLLSNVTQFAHQRQIRAFLTVSIQLGNQFWGVLAAHECFGPRHWQPCEIALLEQLATQVAIAIHQAQLYEQLTTLNANLESQVAERTAQLHEQMQQLEVRTAELTTSQAQMQAILDQTPAIIYIIGVDGCMKFANAEWYRVFGPLFGNSIVGRHLTEFLTPEHAESFFRENRTILAEGTVMSFENDQPLADGVHTYIRTKFPLRDAKGEIYAFCGVSLDITERKQMETALRQSEERFRSLSACSPVGIFEADTAGRCLYTNLSCQRICGFTLEESLGEGWSQFVHPDDRERAFAEWSLCAREGREYSDEFRFQTKDGMVHWVHVRSAPMFAASGELVGHVGTVEDITQRRQAQADILAALCQERELGELRNTFLSLVSHEFRTPLTTIRSSAQLLERYTNRLSDEKKQIHYQRIESAVERMTELLDEVLLIGQAEAGKLKYEPKPIDLVQWCRNLVEGMQVVIHNTHSGRSHQHILTFSNDGNCRNAQMDEKLLEHIFTNLLSNAIKYSPSGGTIQFDVVCADSEAIFRITDSGIGIPKSDLPKLFESFSRASNVGVIQGTGLGLAIVKKAVDLHAGTLAVESEVGVGTTFTVTLPLKSIDH